MQYSKHEVFNALKGVILEQHHNIPSEKISEIKYFWELGLDNYDVIDIIMAMERLYKITNNNITYMKKFGHIGDFCAHFADLLQKQCAKTDNNNTAVSEPKFTFLRLVRSWRQKNN